MDPSRRRCFLEVYTDEGEEPRLLQLEPNVKFHNVLDRFDEDGDLYWQERLIDPEATPASVGMPCGVDQANALWFVPVPATSDNSSTVWSSQNTPLVESTAAVQSLPSPGFAATDDRSPGGGRAPSLPAYFDDASNVYTAPRESRVVAMPASATASDAPMPVPWYSRPRLLSPAQPPQPPAAVTASALASGRGSSPQSAARSPPSSNPPYSSPATGSSPAANGPRNAPALASTGLTPAQLLCQQQQPPRAPPPSAAAAALPPPHIPQQNVNSFKSAPPIPCGPHDSVSPVVRQTVTAMRRNRPILIDPAILVDDTMGPVELLRSELYRLKRDVEALKHLKTEREEQQRQQQRRSVNAQHRSSARGSRAELPFRDEEFPRPAGELFASSPSPIPAPSTDPSVEELAFELHDKQMRRLYEHRRLYPTHGQVTS